jgi:D-alanine-D-alanine ligase
MTKHVAVLMGGWSTEREVSLSTGSECAEGLRQAGFKVSEVDVDHDLSEVLGKLRPDVAFNALHGRWGEDGCIQGLLEVLEIPYTHSGVMASSVAMHKPLAKQVFEAVGIRCSAGGIFGRDAVLAGDVMARPYVIKPHNEGSSVGVHIVFEGDNRLPLDQEGWPYGDEVLVEPYIEGRELTVAVLGNEAIAVTEIFAHAGSFYTYEAKYAEGGSTHEIPADLPADVTAEALDLALRAHQAIGCHGVSRADFRYADATGPGQGLYLLEINTQPGMTPTSLVPEQAAHMGMSFPELMTWIVEDAGCGR